MTGQVLFSLQPDLVDPCLSQGRMRPPASQSQRDAVLNAVAGDSGSPSLSVQAKAMVNVASTAAVVSRSPTGMGAADALAEAD